MTVNTLPLKMPRACRPCFALFALGAIACSDPASIDDAQDGDEYPETVGPIEDYGKADSTGMGAAHKPLPEGASLDGNFRVFYGPHEPMMAVELELLNQVIDARRADPRTFSNADNPYRIRYAVYNLRAREVVDALGKAKKANVFVQVLVDWRQMGPDYPWNTAYDYLEKKGFTVYRHQKGLTETQRREANVIGVEVKGYMHLKTRLFEHPGNTVLITGSANPGENVAFSDDSLHVVREPRIVDAFARCYDAILFGQRVVNEWEEEAPINALFSGNATGVSAGTQILRWFEQEQEQILINVFSLRDFTAKDVSDSLVSLLKRKVEQGVPVYVITDRKQSDGVDENMKQVNSDEPTDDRLRQAGVKVYETLNTASPFTAMHHKAAVLGRSRIRVISGSANWSFSGLGSRTEPAKNLESVLFLDTQRLDDGLTGRRYLANWFRILNVYAHQGVQIDHEAPFSDVFAQFTGTQDWPQESLWFDVRDGDVGDNRIFVAGDVSALGAWGAQHSGLPLVTDEQNYPRWWSEDPVELPLGAPFVWRLWAGASETGKKTWEKTKNRNGLAGPGPFDTPSKVVIDAQWQ